MSPTLQNILDQIQNHSHNISNIPLLSASNSIHFTQQYKTIHYGDEMSNPNDAINQVNQLANVDVSVVIQPPQIFMKNYVLRTAAVVKLGPLPAGMVPNDIQGFITLQDAATGQTISGANGLKAHTGQGMAVSGTAIPTDRADTAYLLFHSLQVPKSGKYRFAVFMMDARTSSGSQVHTRDFEVSTDVAGNETHSKYLPMTPTKRRDGREIGS